MSYMPIGPKTKDYAVPVTFATDAPLVPNVLPVPAEVVLAGAASVLGLIGTVAAAATLLVRCPCPTVAPAAEHIDWRVSCNKAHTLQFYKARSVVNAATITVADATPLDNNDTLILNGLTFTAKDAGTTLASRYFNSGGGDEIATATAICACINDATYGVPGVVAASAGTRVIALTCTTATTLQFAQGTSDANEATFVSTTLLALSQDGAAISGLADNSTTTGRIWPQQADGYPQCYVGLTNNDGAAAATVVVGGTVHLA